MNFAIGCPKIFSWLVCTAIASSSLVTPAVVYAKGKQQLTAAAPKSVDSLLAGFAKLPGFEAEFIEDKQLSLFKAKKVSQGKMYFSKQGYLAQLVEKPFVSHTVIERHQMVALSRGTVQKIEFKKQPEVGYLVGSLFSLLSGDKKKLSEAYSLAYTRQKGGSWQLVLTPKGKRLGMLIKQLVFSGQGKQVTGFKRLEANGDVAETRFVNAKRRAGYSSAETKQLFRLAQ